MFETRSAIITLKGSKLAPLNTLEQLRGAHLGHANGSIVPDYLKALDTDVQPIAGDDYFNRGLKMVELKRFDAYFAPTLTNAQYMVKKYEGVEAMSVQPLPVETMPLYAVFSKSMDEKTFLRLDNLISANLGRYKALLAPYIR